jgi:hypothetical protein
MRALVTYPYRDRETGDLRVVGDEVELTADRFRELSLGGFVGEPPADVPDTPATEAENVPAAEKAQPATDGMTVAQLRAAVEAKGGFAPKKATRAQLISILGSL